MTIERLKNILSYGGKPVRPIGISVGRFNAMIKMAKKALK